MKAKELLNEAFHLRKGSVYMTIVSSITKGNINPRSTYIQTFKSYEFGSIHPDVEFVTTEGETCYLFKVD